MSRITRPSARMLPLRVMKSLIGVAFILAITGAAASEPLSRTAPR